MKSVPAADREVSQSDNYDPMLDEDKPAKKRKAKDVGGISGERLRSFVERIERLEEEKRALAEDIKEVKSESKAVGFDTKVITFLIRQRKIDADDVAEFETLVDVYKRALGMLPD